MSKRDRRTCGRDRYMNGRGRRINGKRRKNGKISAWDGRMNGSEEEVDDQRR